MSGAAQGEMSAERDELLALLLAEEGFAAEEEATRLQPRGDGGPVPLSFAQERVWLLEQLTPSGGAFNMHLLRRLSGHLDLDALGGAIAEVVARHESLRTVFRSAGGVLEQVVLEPFVPALSVHDLRSVAEGSREAELHLLLARVVREPFDLATGPLLAAHAIRLSET
ncbi:MAG TPA: condensation domain-containing protein, partial [Thermoplasmata archaeon]|nr:condensation domain-containing protein [Thermoplasmata archaeon]